MNFTADQLLVFATVVDEGSLTAAARVLDVTQPAVSSRLRSLQTLAGRPLYHAGSRGVELTPAGTALLPHARAVARALGRARQAVAAPGIAELRTAVAISEAAIPLVLPPIAEEALRPPPLDLRVIPCDATTAVETVQAGAADLAVVVAGPDPPTDDLVRRPILIDEIVLVRGGSRPPATGIREIGALVILWQARRSGVRATVERALEARGVWPAASVEVGSSLGVLAAVAAGHGAGFLPRSYVARYVDLGAVTATRLDLPDLDARFEVISAAVDQLPPAASRIVDTLRRIGRFEGEAGT